MPVFVPRILEEVIPFGEGAYIIEFDIGESALNIVGRPLREVREDFVHGLPNVVGVKRDGNEASSPTTTVCSKSAIDLLFR